MSRQKNRKTANKDAAKGHPPQNVPIDDKGRKSDKPEHDSTASSDESNAIDEASQESFPASDPPSRTPVRGVGALDEP